MGEVSRVGEPRGTGPPNLLVILLDCVRASTFPGTGSPLPAFPFLERLAHESQLFTHASTVAPWTLPSHASLFTGRYPWEHGVMGEGRLQFDSSIPTVAGRLRAAGYATLALSANGLITPLLAAPGSFESYRCAEWWEKTFRWIEPESLGGTPEGRPRGGRTALHVLRKGFTSGGRPRTPYPTMLRTQDPAPSFEQAVQNARPEEVPLSRRADTAVWTAIDGANRVARALKAPADPRPLPIAPWIEHALDSWIQSVPAEQPAYCFVNLLDAHEKFLSNTEFVRGLRAWRRFVQIPQNTRLWLEGEWVPTDAEMTLLRRLYESTVAGLEQRVAALIDAYRRAGRWENTLMILTSDHGQAFGEHGELFHERSPYEPLLHVPMWLRQPGGEGGGRIRTEHVGLIDIAPTLLQAAGVFAPSDLRGVALQEDPLPSRELPVLAMADGFPAIETYRGRASEARVLERLRRAFAVAYCGPYKAIVDVRDASVRTFDVVQDPVEAHDLGATDEGERGRAVASAREAAEQIRQASQGTIDPGVHERLKSWGYL
jgi:arylsulfatase A-like enzyme